MKVWEIGSGALGLHDVEPPRPQAGEDLVQVNYAGLCGSDLPKLLNPAGFVLPEPWRPGHEIVGRGPDGRPVAVDPLVPCTYCPPCGDGDTHLCPDLRRLGWDLPGGFAEHIVVPAANVHPLPDDLDPLHAVLADPAAVAVHGLRCSPVGKQGHLAVVGAGVVGHLTALYALQQGWTVTIVHRGGQTPIDKIADTRLATCHSSSALLALEAFEVVVDAATGADSAPLELSLRLVRDGGAVVVQNAYHPDVHLQIPLRDLFRRSIRLIGSFSYCRHARPDDFRVALALLQGHPQQVAHLVTIAGGLTDLPAILADRSQRSARRILGFQ